MRYFYDQEFIEDGNTIEQISIGIVAQDGREYYAVNASMPVDHIRQHKWLMANVVPSLPVQSDHNRLHLQLNDEVVKSPRTIAREVAEFIRPDDPDIELWGWYSAYDHVCLMQMWGPMMSRPTHLPMFTHDLKQEVDRLRVAELPSMPGVAEHHALSDARELKWRFEQLFDQL